MALMTSRSRAALRRRLPGVAAARARRYESKLRADRGITALAERYVTAHGSTTSGGPFRGLRYPPDRLAEVDAPVAKLVGAYEQELASIFTEAAVEGLGLVDVGCADGYYAVGYPLIAPGATSYAYDIAGSARRLCRTLARLNGVEDRVRIGSRVDLEQLPPDAGLMLVDIEGAEVELLTADSVRSLGGIRIVIEAHEDERPGAVAHLTEVLAPTHDVRTVRRSPRRPQDFPALGGWSAEDAQRALDELRAPRQVWLDCRPRASPA